MYSLTNKVLQPEWIDCANTGINANLSNQTIIKRLSYHRDKEIKMANNSDESNIGTFNHSNEYGLTVNSEYMVFCDIQKYLIVPRFNHFIGYIIGALVLGFASDRGGRKMIVLSCIWVNGIMSIFQLVGSDFISFSFFQFFIGLFVGGVQASFFPAILEMFPINMRTFYGVFFHLIVALFELVLPWLAKSFKSWRLLQIFVTVPIALTAVLHWLVYESIFWYLAYKEYDKAIKVLTKLAKRNGLNFEDKFKQAKEFLHAKHSKATQVDILPLLRLQDIDILGQKYPQVDMAELQKQKSNDSKLRRFLNSLKGESYRSTNTIYGPFDFIYSPTTLVYVLILIGLW
jgi:MFS family permease